MNVYTYVISERSSDNIKQQISPALMADQSIYNAFCPDKVMHCCPFADKRKIFALRS
jgi:hypothetical protein